MGGNWCGACRVLSLQWYELSCHIGCRQLPPTLGVRALGNSSNNAIGVYFVLFYRSRHRPSSTVNSCDVARLPLDALDALDASPSRLGGLAEPLQRAAPLQVSTLRHGLQEEGHRAPRTACCAGRAPPERPLHPPLPGGPGASAGKPRLQGRHAAGRGQPGADLPLCRPLRRRQLLRGAPACVRQPGRAPLLLLCRVAAALHNLRLTVFQATLRVTLITPEAERLVEKTFATLDQRELSSILSLYGADGFLRDDGELSRKLTDMREGGTYALVVPARPGLEQAVSPPLLPPRHWGIVDCAVASFPRKPRCSPAVVKPQPAGGRPPGPLG